MQLQGWLRVLRRAEECRGAVAYGATANEVVRLIVRPWAAAGSVDRLRGSQPPRQRRPGSARGDAVAPGPLRNASQAFGVRHDILIGASPHRSEAGFCGCGCY